MDFQLKSVRIENWQVDGAFIIARGAKTYVDVVVATVEGGGVTGRGEATPIYYQGESAQSCRDAIQALDGQSLNRARLAGLLPRGAARNALDCALWQAEAAAVGKPVWELAGLPLPQPLLTAFTISLDRPDAMGDAAGRAAAKGYSLLKLKLTGEGDRPRVAAVRAGAPDARLIVDANESWTDRDVVGAASALLPFGVALIEQPVAAGRDALLDGVTAPIPFAADESCHTRADLPQLIGRYQVVNIKLDKAGGLTEAIELADAAEAAGLDLMVGCMLGTSLAIAPAFALAQRARWVDLDGPVLLASDRAGGFRFADGRIML